GEAGRAAHTRKTSQNPHKRPFLCAILQADSLEHHYNNPQLSLNYPETTFVSPFHIPLRLRGKARQVSISRYLWSGRKQEAHVPPGYFYTVPASDLPSAHFSLVQRLPFCPCSVP